MEPRVGVGRSFRDPGWIERIGLRFRALVARTPFRRPIKLAYEWLLARSPGANLVSVLPGGERVRIDPAHRQLSWNAEEYAAFRSAVRPGSVVLDVGANLGAYTVLFAQWAAPDGRVYAFEPAPESRAGLARQVELNGVGDRIRIRGEAVAGSSGTATFQASGLRGDNRLGVDVPGHDPGLVVRTISVDDFCAREAIDPDVMKIDVEGAELEVLRGARETISRRGSRLTVFVELHPSIWPQLGVTRQQLEAELRAQRLLLERIDDPGGDPWSIEGVCLRLRHATPCAS